MAFLSDKSIEAYRKIDVEIDETGISLSMEDVFTVVVEAVNGKVILTVATNRERTETVLFPVKQ